MPCHRGRLAADSWGAWPTWLSCCPGWGVDGEPPPPQLPPVQPSSAGTAGRSLLFVSSLLPSSVPTVLVLTWQHTERRVSEMAVKN